jgi:hypothetical protein
LTLPISGRPGAAPPDEYSLPAGVPAGT